MQKKYNNLYEQGRLETFISMQLRFVQKHNLNSVLILEILEI